MRHNTNYRGPCASHVPTRTLGLFLSSCTKGGGTVVFPFVFRFGDICTVCGRSSRRKYQFRHCETSKSVFFCQNLHDNQRAASRLERYVPPAPIRTSKQSKVFSRHTATSHAWIRTPSRNIVSHLINPALYIMTF